MNLKEEILREHSKAQCQKIVDWVGHNRERFDELFQLFVGKDKKIVQRSSWPLSYCVENEPSFISNYFGSVLQKIKEEKAHDAVKRNGLKLLNSVEIPLSYEGEIMDLCFQLLEAPEETVAVKMFSLKILGNMTKKYPEICNEVMLMIEAQLPNATPGFRCAAKDFERLMKK